MMKWGRINLRFHFFSISAPQQGCLLLPVVLGWGWKLGGGSSSDAQHRGMASTEPCLAPLLPPTKLEQEEQFYTNSCIHIWVWPRGP